MPTNSVQNNIVVTKNKHRASRIYTNNSSTKCASIRKVLDGSLYPLKLVASYIISPAYNYLRLLSECSEDTLYKCIILVREEACSQRAISIKHLDESTAQLLEIYSPTDFIGDRYIVRSSITQILRQELQTGLSVRYIILLRKRRRELNSVGVVSRIC